MLVVPCSQTPAWGHSAKLRFARSYYVEFLPTWEGTLSISNDLKLELQG